MLIGVIIAIATAILLLGSTAAGWAGHKKRSLRTSFGPEYETVAQEHDTKQDVDRELLRRKRLYDRLSLHAISVDDQEYHSTAWERLQAGFLDDPALALSSAGQLVSQLLDARGYPGEDPDEQLALLSVNHADTPRGLPPGAADLPHTFQRTDGSSGRTGGPMTNRHAHPTTTPRDPPSGGRTMTT
jgi:hypothetical protein